MRAVEATAFGEPSVLEAVERPDPVPGEGEALIDVAFAEVLFVDTQVRSGWGADFFPMRPPFVPGTGVAGVSDGRRVVARTGDEGGYASRVVVPRADIHDVPEGLELEVAVTALHDGTTSLSRLDRAAIQPGERVLVTAAAGSLGAWLVPLAREAGATVVAAASSEEKRGQARAAGAHEVLDYGARGWLDGEEPFDVVFDGSGGAVGSAAFAHTAEGGRFFSHGAASGDFAETGGTDRGITVVDITEQIPDAEWDRQTRRGLELLATGTVKPPIGQTVPLERAADAHAAIEARAVIGKTVLSVA